MKLTPIVGGGAVRCKKCGMLAKFLVYFDAAKKEIPLCKDCATDICAIYDLKVLQKVAKGEMI